MHGVTLGLMAVPTVLLFVVWFPLVRFVSVSLAQWIPSVAPATTDMLQ